jgi:hypothetical protein
MIRTQTLEERRAYNSRKQRERRARLIANPLSVAEYRRSEAATTKKYREKLKNDPERLAKYRERARARDKARYVASKNNSAPVENTGLQMLKNPP